MQIIQLGPAERIEYQRHLTIETGQTVDLPPRDDYILYEVVLVSRGSGTLHTASTQVALNKQAVVKLDAGPNSATATGKESLSIEIFGVVSTRFGRIDEK